MKTNLIIINWLASWLPLCYGGENLLIAACAVAWFGISTRLFVKTMNAECKEKELTD